jgi:outer membrane protein assembly factor BamB
MASIMGRVDAQRTGYCKSIGPKSTPPSVRWWAGPERGVLMEIALAFMTPSRDPTPVVLDGVVYAIIDKGILYGIDLATGETRLTIDFNAGGGNLAGWSAPAVVDDTVYVCVAYSVIALDIRSGGTRWHFSDGWLFAKFFGLAAPIVVDNVVYVTADNGHLFALDAVDGTLRWSVTVKGLQTRTSSPAVADGLVFVTIDKFLMAFDAETGKRVWGMEGDQIFITSPTIANGLVIVADWNRVLYALETDTGEERWHYTASSSPCASLAEAEGMLYVPLEDGKLIALTTSSGQPQWTVYVGKNSSAPTVADGIVYLRTGKGSVYALGTTGGDCKWQLDLSPAALWYGDIAVAEENILVGSLHAVYALGHGPRRPRTPAQGEAIRDTHQSRLRRI